MRKSSFSTGLLVGLAAAFLISGPTVFASPISWWKFDEGSGSTAYDSAGSHDGPVTGATWTTEGKINSALHFDASGDYVSITGLEPGNQWTFAAWVKSDVNISFSAPQRDNILLSSSQCRIDLGTNVFGREGNLRFVISQCGTLYSNKNFWKANEWYYITCTRDGPSKAVYVNGVLDNSQNQMCLDGGGWFITYIGGDFLEPSDSFDGVIDDVRIYNIALSAGEVWQIYGEGFGGRAFSPNPYDGAANVAVDKILSWSPGKDTNSHNVYLGTDYNDVNNADTSSPEYMGSFDVNSFTPGGLEYGTTCYWRIDEVNEPNLWKGDVWSFSTIEGLLHVPSEYPTIQAAIDASFNGNTVVVAPGTYTGTGNRDIDFKGKAITVRSTDPNDPNIVAATIIDCQNISGHRGFYFHSGEDANSTLAGFTVTNGKIVGSGVEGGGGIYCTGSSPAITKCIISNNVCGNAGGAIFCYQSSPSISACTITGNSAHYMGGIYCRDSSPNIIACTFSNNIGGGIYGGGPGYYPTITDCTISGSSDNSGISFCWGPITNCTITGNKTDNEGGGGIYECNGPVTNCIISGNSADGDGGGMHRCYGPITNCLISGNSAEYSGGGLFLCTGHITNCIISDNNAGYEGGGLSNCSRVTNCTIIGNIAGLNRDFDYHGGGIYGAEAVTNCIVRDNWPTQIDSAGVVYSNVQGGWIGEGNIDADPCFAFSSNYHITPDSPCVDAGTNDPCGGLPPADIEGTPRPLDGNNDGNAVADMGAYEQTPDSPFIVVSAVNLYFTQDWPKLDPQTKKLFIKNCGGQPLHWQIIEDCNWLQVSPASGTGQISEVNVTVDPNGLAPGRYSCDFDVRDINAPNNPVTIHVTIGQVLLVPQDFNTIQKAIDAADNADIVLVADGNYTGDGNTNLDFRGKLITVCSENGPNNCIIDCQDSGDDFHFQNRESKDAVVDGFTITNAFAGIYCGCRSSPTIKNCIIRNNGRYDMGGGILCEAFGNPAIAECNISGNDNYGIYYGFENPYYYSGIPLNASITGSIIRNNSGGGVFTGDCGGKLTVTNCTITDNLNYYGYYGHNGGLICLDTDRYDPEYGYTGVSLEITSSIVSGNTGGWYGGGIICGDGSKIIDCNITGNSATYATGIYCTSSTTVADCTITGNSANRGAGIYCLGGSDTIIANCTITGNIATEYAGGIRYIPHHSEEYEEKNNPTIKSCIITGNSAGKAEAGISCWGGNPTITNCTVTGNTAVEYGGGISCSYDSNATITDCNISGNSARLGGGIYCSESSPVIANCAISDNNGPGILCSTDSSPTIINCTVTGNTGSQGPGGASGGGISCYRSSPGITNCTITGNLAERFGGGIYSYMSNLTITNSIIYGNEAPDDGPEIYLTSTSNLWLGYSDVQAGLAAIYVGPDCTLNWGLGNIDTDPRFVDPANGDYHLKSEGWRWDVVRHRWTYDNVTSRCIDAGNPGSPLGDEPLSVPDDPDNEWGQNLRIDMGAFGGTAEASIPPYYWALLADLTNDGLVDLTDFAYQAADWLDSADRQPGDLNRDGLIDIDDLALLVGDWLGQTAWH